MGQSPVYLNKFSIFQPGLISAQKLSTTFGAIRSLQEIQLNVDTFDSVYAGFFASSLAWPVTSGLKGNSVCFGCTTRQPVQ